jgi:hypothetical protein
VTEDRSGVDAVFRALDRSAAEDAQWRQRIGERERQARVDRELRGAFVAHCRAATAGDYAAWLAGWLRRGGDISHVYDYPLADPGVTEPSWLVLQSRPDGFPSLYGASSVHVIVPEGVGVAAGDIPRTSGGDACGHSTFYFLDGFEVVGSWVPLYSDVRQILAEVL